MVQSLEFDKRVEYYAYWSTTSQTDDSSIVKESKLVDELPCQRSSQPEGEAMLYADFEELEQQSGIKELSAETLRALCAHLEDEKQQDEAEALMVGGPQLCKPQPGMAAFREDWSLRQFWYTRETATALAKEVLAYGDDKRVAILCAPTLWKALQDLDDLMHEREIYLLEFDERFSILGPQFFKYDVSFPEKLHPMLLEQAGTFDLCFSDPPFLTEGCIGNLAKTMKLLAKPEGTLLICTGEECRDIVSRHLDCHPVAFTPEHKTLRNPFLLYSNQS